MLNKRNRLPASEFPKVFSKGYKSRGEFGMLIGVPTSNKNPQFGFVVSKKIGNAVQRHKMTRRLREISRSVLKEKQLTSLKFQYVLFKYTDDFVKLKNEFGKQIDFQIQKWSKN